MNIYNRFRNTHYWLPVKNHIVPLDLFVPFKTTQIIEIALSSSILASETKSLQHLYIEFISKQ